MKALLNNQPRWLRPKDRDEEDSRIAGLSKGKSARKAKRKYQYAAADRSYQKNLDASILNNPSTSTNVADRVSMSSTDNLVESEFSYSSIQNKLSGAQHDTLWKQEAPSYEDFAQPRKFSTQIQQGRGDRTIRTSDQGTLSTHFSTSSLKQRLPKYSDSYLSGIIRLVKAYSISGSSAATSDRHASTIQSEDLVSHSDANTLRPSREKAATLFLPDAFLKIDRYKARQGFCNTGLQSHDAKTCWCAVLDELGPRRALWVEEMGLTMDVADPPQSLWNLDPIFKDDFGNGVLHFLAARGAPLEVIAETVNLGIDVNAKNTAGQNFLHLLLPSFLCNLAENKQKFISALELLTGLGANFHDCDCFGRSFLHVLAHLNLDLPLEYILNVGLSNLGTPCTRDAYGWPRKSQASGSNLSPTLAGHDFLPGDAVTTSGVEAINAPTSSKCINESPMCWFDETFVFKQARLLETARNALDHPTTEDSYGRNGLHCLAAASLMMKINVKQPKTFRKRKRDGNVLGIAPSRLTLRYEMVQNLLRAGVHANHYDDQGYTVLMSFVMHLPDGEEDRNLELLLNHLILHGADIHSRNRQGETALHIAVRLGRKIATRVLLQNGANVFARTVEGKGIWALGDKVFFKAKSEPESTEQQTLYSSVMACLAMAVRYGAVSRPTLVQEWSKTEGFAMHYKLQGKRHQISESQMYRDRKHSTISPSAKSSSRGLPDLSDGESLSTTTTPHSYTSTKVAENDMDSGGQHKYEPSLGGGYI